MTTAIEVNAPAAAAYLVEWQGADGEWWRRSVIGESGALALAKLMGATITALYPSQSDAREAFRIADRCMFELLTTHCIPQDLSDTALAITNELGDEVRTMADASEAIAEAFNWLEPRGYVSLVADGSGEYIGVNKRPGEDQ